MDCQEYLRQYSDYFDGLADAELSRAMEEHRSACGTCRRYAEILEAGAGALRDLPAIDLPSDFRARLDHRIFHIEDGPSIARESMGTGATTVSILALAALLAVSAWAPVVGTPRPMAELPALIVVGPAQPALTEAPASTSFHRSRSLFTTTQFREGIWGDSHELFREYSSLSERRRAEPVVQVGSQ
jgi:anti-sigma factor RsiW